MDGREQSPRRSQRRAGTRRTPLLYLEPGVSTSAERCESRAPIPSPASRTSHAHRASQDRYCGTSFRPPRLLGAGPKTCYRIKNWLAAPRFAEVRGSALTPSGRTAGGGGDVSRLRFPRRNDGCGGTHRGGGYRRIGQGHEVHVGECGRPRRLQVGRQSSSILPGGASLFFGTDRRGIGPASLPRRGRAAGTSGANASIAAT